ncbi:MAG: 50S ribosomal protein L4 [Desulfatiglandaceae bacterium]|jgi:large subunit ribosomal protein L4
MSVVDVYNLQKEKISELELNEGVFNVPVKKHVLHQVVLGQLATRRSGSAATKTRSEIQSSGAKLWRQKGTGRARAGVASSPTRRGGGVAFGPSPRSYTHRTPKKLRKAAIRMALTDKALNRKLVVLENFNLPEIKTKNFVEVLKTFDVRKTLVVTEEKNVNLEKSSQNVPWVKVMRYEGLNVYDILKFDYLFVVRPAIEKIEEALVE